MEALVDAFDHEKALVGAFSVIMKTEGSFAALLKNIENWLQMLSDVCGWDTDGAAEEAPQLDTCEYRHRVVNTVSQLSQPRPAEESLNLLIKFKIV